MILKLYGENNDLLGSALLPNRMAWEWTDGEFVNKNPITVELDRPGKPTNLKFYTNDGVLTTIGYVNELFYMRSGDSVQFSPGYMKIEVVPISSVQAEGRSRVSSENVDHNKRYRW